VSDLEKEIERVNKAYPDLTPAETSGLAARVILTRMASNRVTDLHPEQLPRLTEIVAAMQESWFKEMNYRQFFPFYSENGEGAILRKDLPKIDYSKDAKPRIDQLKDALGENAKLADWPFYPDDEAIAELFYPSPIDGDDTVTLFEASIMIGARLLGGPHTLALRASAFFAAELLNGAIDPLEPFMRVRWSRQPRQTPDLTWRISPIELQKFAREVWGSGVYKKVELDEAEIEPKSAPTTEDPPKADRSNYGLYKMIRALTLALADTNPEIFKKNGSVLAGYSEDWKDKDSGIIGHLKAKKYLEMSGSTAQKFLSRAFKYK